ncbi:hypothetical protein [Apibacter sp. B2912]|uniref:hypothetical protein n=1 Tax=Apibacter sp. B2912 TaxID=2656763 RepID=UPI0013686EA8|nr:hypothetical protein [Apibacter sp. B2912]MXO32307.1 hypothetical protein [Apibacter sp. B2912]
MNFSIQPNLENDYVQILPLEINDFESLYQVVKDKKIWEQHPCHNRWKEDVFKYVDKIYFHIGSTNFRSQKAIAKINAILLKYSI